MTIKYFAAAYVDECTPYLNTDHQIIKWIDIPWTNEGSICYRAS